MYENINYDVKDSVAVITLVRPALDLKLCEEFLDVVIKSARDPQVRAIVLASANKNFFLGGDLAYFSASGDQADALLAQMTANLDRAVSLLYRANKPTIAAVNGAAAGAGMGLALQADFVIAEESASFVSAYTAAGLSPDTSTTYFLPRLVGERRAKEMFITNRKVKAPEALEWGMVNSVVEDGKVLDEAMTLAARLAAGPTSAFGSVKRLVAASFGNTLDGQLSMEAELLGVNSVSADGQEGIASFLEKRAPKFSGK